jgi:hypothetical protein
MSSPEVWADAKPRLQAAADELGAVIQWPNEPAEEPEPGPDGNLPLFLAVEIEGDAAEPVELGGATWDENGTVYVHVLVPTGSAIDAALAARKAIANRFRGLAAGAVRYDGFRFPPGGTDETSGNWYRARADTRNPALPQPCRVRARPWLPMTLSLLRAFGKRLIAEGTTSAGRGGLTALTAGMGS